MQAESAQIQGKWGNQTLKIVASQVLGPTGSVRGHHRHGFLGGHFSRACTRETWGWGPLLAQHPPFLGLYPPMCPPGWWRHPPE